MTYCAGWTYRDSAYLIADSVFGNCPPAEAIFSFGEFPAPGVEESSLKIAPIGEDMAIAFAGIVNSATEICTYIRDLVKTESGLSDPEKLFDRVGATYLGNATATVDILLIKAAKGCVPKLFLWDNHKGLDRSVTDFADIGSGALAVPAQENVALGRERQIREQRFLPTIMASAQWWTRINRATTLGVGGPIFGLRIAAGTVTWQADTVYVLYDKVKAQQVSVVYVIARANALGVFSTFTNEVRVFAFPFSHTSGLQSINDIRVEVQRVNDWRLCVCSAISPTNESQL